MPFIISALFLNIPQNMRITHRTIGIREQRRDTTRKCGIVVTASRCGRDIRIAEVF